MVTISNLRLLKKTALIFLFLWSTTSGFKALGQVAGTIIDNLINPWANGAVNQMKVLPDGNIIITGNFTTYNDQPRARIARITQNSALDESFDPGEGFPSAPNDFVLLPDGKIVVVGNFTNYNGVSTPRIVRLNADGSLDNTFNPGAGADNFISRIVRHSDGKFMIIGDFQTYDGASRNGIARLNADGSLDTSFNPGTGFLSTSGTFVNEPFDIVIQSTGKVILGGDFERYNGVRRVALIRLNTDGSLDNTFNIGAGPSNSMSFIPIIIEKFVLLSGDQVLVHGVYDRFNNQTAGPLVRLNSDGSLDNSFAPNLSNYDIVHAFNGSDKIYFTQNASGGKALLRWNMSGSLDGSFNAGSQKILDGSVSTVDFLFSNPLVAGSFSNYDGFVRKSMVLIDFFDGTIRETFTPGRGVDPAFGGRIDVIRQQANGQYYISGAFKQYNFVPQKGIARLNADFSLDQTFVTRTTDDFIVVSDFEVLSDGKLILVGEFRNYDGVTTNGIVKVNPDGSIDPTFQPEVYDGNFSRFNEVEVLDDGKLLVGGSFTKVFSPTNENRRYIIRLNPDGSIDNNFPATEGTNGEVSSIHPLSNGQFLIGGGFTQYQGSERTFLAKLNSDGTLDTSFVANISPAPGSPPRPRIESIQIQKDGRILIAGEFGGVDGQSRNNIARLNPDGTLDPTLNVGSGANRDVFRLDIQPDGKIIVGGYFTLFNGGTHNGIVRLLENGSIDESFDPGVGFPTPNGVNYSIIQDDGKMILTGLFANYNNNPRLGIVEIFCSVPQAPRALVASALTDSSFVLSWDILEGIGQYEVDVSDNGFLNFLPDYFSRFLRDTTLLIENLSPGNVYSCRVRARNEQGASPDSEVIQVIIPPGIPQNFRARAISSRQVELTWEFDPLDENIYKIQFAKDTADAFTDLTLISGNTFVHNDLQSGTRYFYTIQAFKNGVFSEPSEVVGATTAPDVITNSVEDLAKSIKVYPNPNQEMIIIEQSTISNDKINIRLFNAQGNTVFEDKPNISKSSLRIPLNQLPSGLYFLEIQQHGNSVIKKIIKN